MKLPLRGLRCKPVARRVRAWIEACKRCRQPLTPRALLQSGGRPYLTAYCHTDRIEKTYRLDRIRELHIEE